MSLYPLLRSLLFQLPPETAHQLTLTALAMGLSPTYKVPPLPKLHQTLAGLTFPSPVGLAAGFDKNAEAIEGLLRIGFSFIEVGTVTPIAQRGAPKPRLFRVKDHQAIINRMGFNNKGLDPLIRRLNAYRQGARHWPGLIGVNLGKNKATTHPSADYCLGIAESSELADYLTLNISSPNTPNLRDLQFGRELETLLTDCLEARSKLSPEHQKPLFVKLAPDGSPDLFAQTIQTLKDTEIDGIILTNTTIHRPDYLSKQDQEKQGGLSGLPLQTLSTQRIAQAYHILQGTKPIIGCGGINSVDSAWEKILAGANLVQLYTALIYQGPSLVPKITLGLHKKLMNSTYTHFSEAVGANYQKYLK